MSTYTCPDCKDGELEAKVREVDLELQDGETAQIVGGVAVIASVSCNNGCSAEAEDDEEEGAAPETNCTKPGCKKTGSHRHYSKTGGSSKVGA